MAEITTYLSPNGRQSTRGAGPATRILVATVNGVATLGRAGPGAPWKLEGRSLEDRHVGSLEYEESSGKLFAGAHDDGGLWVSDDGAGAAWRPLTNGLDRPHVYSLAVRRRGDQVSLFLGTSPAGLYRSDDLGESWSEIKSILAVPGTDEWTFPPPPHIAHVKQVVFHPNEPDTIFCLIEQGAFLKSVDDGKSWTELAGYSDPADEVYHDAHRLLIRPDDPNVMYFLTGVGIYRSGDGGQTYDHLMQRGDRVGYPDAVFLDPNDNKTIYMGGSLTNPGAWRETGMADSCVLRSTDEGRTWLELDHGLPETMAPSIEAMCQHVWNGGMMLVAGTATGEVYVTEDCGASWDQVSGDVRPVSKDHHHLAFLPEAERKAAMALRSA
jgi:photosystem II stability/assembly factor-like uncharacterized protein